MKPYQSAWVASPAKNKFFTRPAMLANMEESVPVTGSVQQPKTYEFCDHLLSTISYRGNKTKQKYNTVQKLTPFNLTQRNLVRLRHNDRLRPGLD